LLKNKGPSGVTQRVLKKSLSVKTLIGVLCEEFTNCALAECVVKSAVAAKTKVPANFESSLKFEFMVHPFEKYVGLLVG
jgi:hypothetical protein